MWGHSEGGQLHIQKCNTDTYGKIHCPTQGDNSAWFAQGFPKFKTESLTSCVPLKLGRPASIFMSPHNTVTIPAASSSHVELIPTMIH